MVYRVGLEIRERSLETVRNHPVSSGFISNKGSLYPVSSDLVRRLFAHQVGKRWSIAESLSN